MNLIEWIISEGYARNNFQASHIANGLQLAQIADQPELQQERVRLYRAWRPVTETKKSKRDELPSWQAYQLAIYGLEPNDVEPRQIEMPMAESEDEE